MCKRWTFEKVSRLTSLPTVKWFQVFLLLNTSSGLKLSTMQSVSLSKLSILLVLCRGLVDPWTMHCLILIGDFFWGILKMLPGLSCFTLLFICIFPAWLMELCDFCLTCSAVIGDKCFSLSLMLLSRRSGDLCNGYFFWRFFAHLAVVSLRMVDRACNFVWFTWDLSSFLE